MEDLLREEDFARKKYNPGRRFVIFYLLTFVATIVVYYSSPRGMEIIDDGFAALSASALPLIISILMVFHKKEIATDSPLKLIGLSAGILTIFYFLALILINIINIKFEPFTLTSLWYCILLSVVNLIVSLAIILPIVAIKQKNNTRWKTY